MSSDSNDQQPAVPVDVQLTCSFCNLSQDKAGKIIRGPSVNICRECIALCNDIIDGECEADSADEGAAPGNPIANCSLCGLSRAAREFHTIGERGALCVHCVGIVLSVLESANDEERAVGALHAARHRPAPFMHAFDAVASTLMAGGFRLAVENYDHAKFGSAYAVFQGRGRQVRLVWDGKEQALWAETRSEPSREWRDVEGLASGRTHDMDYAVGDARIERLVAALKVVIDRC